ncbi:MAG: ACP S-malonyltransferase [Thermoleophilia bacterium]
MGKLALVFPGQGSQAVGMGAAMALRYETAAAVFRHADELLGWSVADLCFQGPAEKLNRTEFSQPALFVSSVAILGALRERGVTGDVVTGHSLGEYSALLAAGAMDFTTGLELVAFRGRIMAEAAQENPGSMAAVLGLTDDQVEEVCTRIGNVWPVNYNSPGQVVISGETGAVRQAGEEAAVAGAKKVVELAVSGAFHSPLMATAAARMREHLVGVELREPQPPFVSSISCEAERASGLKDLLVSQMVSPVRWRQTVDGLIAGGVDRFLEIGSGKVLCGLIRRINRDVSAANVSDPEGLEKALATGKS